MIGCGLSLPEVATRGSIAWTPAKLGANLLTWYDASIAGSLSLSSSDVNTWADLGGGGHTLSSAVAHKPTFSATGLNGRPAVMFSQSLGTWLDSVANALSLGTTAAMSFYALALMNSGTAAFGRLAAFLAQGQTQDFNNTLSVAALYRDNTNNNIQSQRNSVVVGTNALALATPAVLAAVYDGTNGTVYVNDVAATPTVSGGNFGSSGSLRLGADFTGSGGTSYWDGALAELFVTNEADPATHAKAYAYLKAKGRL